MPTNAPLESNIERACVQLAEEHRCVLLKLEGNRGWPDRILLTPRGQMAFVEFKRAWAAPRPLQIFTLKKLRDMNFMAVVVQSTSEFKIVLNHLSRSPGSHIVTKPEESNGS